MDMSFTLYILDERILLYERFVEKIELKMFFFFNFSFKFIEVYLILRSRKVSLLIKIQNLM